MKFDGTQFSSGAFVKTGKVGVEGLTENSVPRNSGKNTVANVPANTPKRDGMLTLDMDAETILIVNDSTEIRHALSRDLSNLGYKPLTAATHKQAVHYLEDNENKVSVAMVDLVLGHEDGLALLEVLSTRWPNMRRILMSGYVLPVTLELVRSCGCAHAVMTKPWNSESLKKAIKVEPAE